MIFYFNLQFCFVFFAIFSSFQRFLFQIFEVFDFSRAWKRLQKGGMKKKNLLDIR